MYLSSSGHSPPLPPFKLSLPLAFCTFDRSVRPRASLTPLPHDSRNGKQYVTVRLTVTHFFGTVRRSHSTLSSLVRVHDTAGLKISEKKQTCRDGAVENALRQKYETASTYPGIYSILASSRVLGAPNTRECVLLEPVIGID